MPNTPGASLLPVWLEPCVAVTDKPDFLARNAAYVCQLTGFRFDYNRSNRFDERPSDVM